MKSLLVKLVIVLVALVGWMLYDNRQAITSFSLAGLKNSVSTKLPVRLESKGGATTVYKWQDQSGKWHFSDTQPQEAKTVVTTKIRSDQNVIQSYPLVPDADSSDSHAANLELLPAIVGKPSPGSSTSVSGQAVADENDISLPLSPARYKEALDRAKAARNAMEQRNQNLDNLVVQ